MKINKIVIVGGGSAGWMTAATLTKAFPDKKISIIEPSNIPTVGVGESTLGSIKRWTNFIGLDEKDFIPSTDASFKMSIKFTDFYKKDIGSFHYPFGNPLLIDNRNPFFDWHAKKYFYPETKVNDFVESLFPSFQLFNNNKMSTNRYGEFDNFSYNQDVAYHFDASKFAVWIKNYLLKNKSLNLINNEVSHIEKNNEGIEYIQLNDGYRVYADLFVDCTGFKSLLIGEAMNEPFDDYSEMLPNNKAWATRINYINKEKEMQAYTNCTAIENGWCWNIPLWSRLGSGYVYSDQSVSDEDALKEFKKYLQSNKMVENRTIDEVENLEYKNIKMKVGIHKRTFVKNVVAVGLSAGFIEPLESNGLFSVHEFLFKLVDILQRGDISQFDRDMYNISVRDLFDNFAKFVALHYALSHRDDTRYWKIIKEKSFSDRYNDPYFPFIGRTDSFYDISRRYMNSWQHELGPAGITYISTGMNLFMLNESRFNFIDTFSGNNNLKKEIDGVIKIWEERKNKWKTNANGCLSLNNFVKKFY